MGSEFFCHSKKTIIRVQVTEDNDKHAAQADHGVNIPPNTAWVLVVVVFADSIVFVEGKSIPAGFADSEFVALAAPLGQSITSTWEADPIGKKLESIVAFVAHGGSLIHWVRAADAVAGAGLTSSHIHVDDLDEALFTEQASSLVGAGEAALGAERALARSS